MSDELIAETLAKIESLILELPKLEGKANKNARCAVNKEIHRLENGDEYTAALKRRRVEEAAAAAAAAAAAETAAEAAAAAKVAAENLQRPPKEEMQERHYRQLVEEVKHAEHINLLVTCSLVGMMTSLSPQSYPAVGTQVSLPLKIDSASSKRYD